MKKIMLLFLVVGLFSCKKSEINDVKIVEEPKPLPPMYTATYSCEDCIVTSLDDGKSDTIKNGSKVYYGVMTVKKVWRYTVKFSKPQSPGVTIAQYGDRKVDINRVVRGAGMKPGLVGEFFHGVENPMPY